MYNHLNLDILRYGLMKLSNPHCATASLGLTAHAVLCLWPPETVQPTLYYGRMRLRRPKPYWLDTDNELHQSLF